MSSTQASNEQPRYFYKYGRVDDERICHTKRIFEANELYFSTIDEFNDPFDCYSGLVISGESNAVKEYLNKTLKQQEPTLKRHERRALVSEYMKKCQPSTEGVSFEVPEENKNASRKEWRIYCLSETYDNIQMWAHYTDGHKGFCLKFLNAENEPFSVPAPSGDFKEMGTLPQRVTYSDQFPIINRISDDDIITDVKSCLTKASGWSYEKEWRMVDLSGPGPRYFSPHFLKSVIFGCKMTDDHKQLIRKWCEGRDPAVTFHEARISAGSYSLEIDAPGEA